MSTPSGKPVGTIRPGDVVIFFNYRNDRAKELTVVLTQEDMPAEGMHTLPLYYCCMTPYDAKFQGLHILFDKENVQNTIGEYVSSQGLSQLRIAETEKYAHVTFFLNGGREAKFAGEDRILVASPKVATYDLQPEMSAYEVTDKLVEALDSQKYDFICLNFANGDMVGHTGVYDAIVKAVKAVDECVGEVVEAAKRNGYEVVQIADHGNADNADQCRRYAQHGALAQSGAHRRGIGPREDRTRRRAGRRSSYGAQTHGARTACRDDGQGARRAEIAVFHGGYEGLLVRSGPFFICVMLGCKSRYPSSQFLPTESSSGTPRNLRNLLINLVLRSPCIFAGTSLRLDRLRLGKMQTSLLLLSACTIFVSKSCCFLKRIENEDRYFGRRQHGQRHCLRVGSQRKVPGRRDRLYGTY